MVYRDERTVVVVDAQNQWYSAINSIGQPHISYEKLLEHCTAGRPLVRATAYCVWRPDGSNQDNFERKLRSLGWYFKWKQVRQRNDGTEKADWDMGIFRDLATLADKVDVVHLVSGDGDFVPMVQYLQSRGVYVEVSSFSSGFSDDLKSAADEFFILDKNISIENGKNRNGGNGKTGNGKTGNGKTGNGKTSNGKTNNRGTEYPPQTRIPTI